MTKREKLVEAGFEYDEAVRRMGDSEERYYKYIKRFPADDNINQAKEIFANKDYGNAEFPIHTLKGLAGNLGVTPVFTISQTIIDFLRKGENEKAAALFPKLVEEFERCSKIILEVEQMSE